ncbi:MAG: 16S rRNA (guanine(527)-N(7))-methyltransferase RsmG [Treponema sp.]|nr:16S rRNA (guanine(527)-N(7))-methyltransferase RsmG [Treponema sp.]
MPGEITQTRTDFQCIEIIDEGLDVLCQNDPDARILVAPRRDAIVKLLCAYISEIESQNPALGLVGTNDRQELIRRHILDSLAPLGLFSRLLQKQGRGGNTRCADVGSGAGLPGIPLAIAAPQMNFTLIERMGRRANFLRGTLAALDIANATVAEANLEQIAHNIMAANAPRFDLVTFRAFKPLEPKIMKSLFRICAPNGVIAAYKGRREKIDAEISALEQFFVGSCKSKIPVPVCEVIPCPTPLLAEERHMVVIRR